MTTNGYPGQSPVEQQIHRSPRILAVDDEKTLAWTIGLMLAKAGYDVVTFSNPLLLLDEFYRLEPDLVISDVMMPEMSGIDLAISLRQHRPRCKIILLSGQAATLHLLERAKEQGLDFEVLPKPISPRSLLAFVEESVGLPN